MSKRFRSRRQLPLGIKSRMLLQASQQPINASLRDCLAAHLEPDIHLPSIARLLDVLAHVALLAERLYAEIERIRRHSDLELDSKDRMYLAGIRATVEEAGRTIWKESLRIRELGIAKPLTSANPRLRIIQGMIEMYYGSAAAQQDVKPGDLGRPRESNEPLFLSAAPASLAGPLAESSTSVRLWHTDMAESGGEGVRAEIQNVCRRADDIRKSVLEAATQVFECIDMASTVLDTYAHKRLVIEVKHEDNGRDARKTALSGRSRSAQPALREVQAQTPAPPPRENTPLSNEPRQRHINNDVGPTVAVPQVDSRLAGDMQHPVATEPRQALQPRPTSKPIKKRARQSLPPREGPDYMRHGPATPPDTKRPRVHPFQSKDVRKY